MSIASVAQYGRIKGSHGKQEILVIPRVGHILTTITLLGELCKHIRWTNLYTGLVQGQRKLIHTGSAGEPLAIAA